jgi:hypothetical protein
VSQGAEKIIGERDGLEETEIETVEGRPTRQNFSNLADSQLTTNSAIYNAKTLIREDLMQEVSRIVGEDDRVVGCVLLSELVEV